MLGIELKDVYIEPRTDFGFRYLFGTPKNKDLLIGFLNALFHGTHTITDLTYLNGEQLGIREEDRRAIFDVYCETESGEKFIVEMQNVFQQFYKDRSEYYSTFPICELTKQDNGDIQPEFVYTVGILNFVFHEDKNSEDYFHHEVKLMDVNTKKAFYDKLTFIYLELPKFTKTENELETIFEKWVFVLKNLSGLLEHPVVFQERVFKRLFEAASIAKLTPKELWKYEASFEAYRDIVNAVNTARMKGLEEERTKGEREIQIEIARNLKEMGLEIPAIRKATGLTTEEIQEL